MWFGCFNKCDTKCLAKELGLTLKPTLMTVTMADHREIKPLGVACNMRVKVVILSFLVDFMVFYESNGEILGHPFLATWKTKIDVCKGTLKLRNDSKIEKLYMYEPINLRDLGFKGIQ